MQHFNQSLSYRLHMIFVDKFLIIEVLGDDMALLYKHWSEISNDVWLNPVE